MYRIDLQDTRLRNLPRLLQIQAEHNGEQEFLISDDLRVSFKQAETLSGALATGLHKLGVKAGDNVALYLENRAEMVLFALAVNKLQAIWVPINTDYKGEWLRNTLQHSKPVVLITQQSLFESCSAELEKCSIPNLVVLDSTEQPSYQDLSANIPYQTDYSSIDYGDTCAIMWTSGTTGKSKGVMLSHNCWLRPIINGTSVFYDSQPGDIILNVLPMFHAGAWNTAVLRALLEGIPVVLEKRFSVSNFWQRINHFGATQSFTLGAMHMFLWNAQSAQDDAQTSLQTLQAVPMPSELVPKFEQRFDLKILGAGYGQSECMMITTTAGHGSAAPEHSMGFAADDLEIKLFDDQDKIVAAGEVGEIRMRPLAPHIICNGYFDNPQASEQAWRGEWFCSGDMATVDANGAYYFSDRKKDAVRFAGRNISTLEVEGVVRKHPSIADVAVFGIPCSELEAEDELKIDVVLKPEQALSPEQLAKHINDHAPYYFVPRYIEFVDQLPYTPTNKIQKFKLRERGISAATWDRNASNYKVQKR